MKPRTSQDRAVRHRWLAGAAVAAALALPTVGAAQPADPNHRDHQAHAPTTSAASEKPLSEQVGELRAKVVQLEAALAKNAPHSSATSAPAVGAMPGMAAPAAPMAGMKSGVPGAMKPAGGMGGMSAPPSGTVNKMAMMEKMMGMMDKMMSMGDGAMPAGTPMAGGDMGMMDMDDKMEMGGKGGGGMSGGGMGMMNGEMMQMKGMMGMAPGAGMAMPSALPGFPGASHLYHVGSTGFFLDHAEHVTLTTQQQTALNAAKEKALLDKANAQRAIDGAEQELWTLPASDQPDTEQIEAKVSEIEKLRGDQRLGFIRAVGEAAKVLTEEQRKSLLGQLPPQNQGAQPAPGGGTSGGGGGMKDM